MLNKLDRLFSGVPVIPLHELGPLPPPPSAQTRKHNIIAFSLFGNDSKYCEPAVLNVQNQPHAYPHWVCRFYVDNSVPGNVIRRIQRNGGQITHVTGSAAQWPGEMWRFLALNDLQAHRILFRDADSLISPREAAAVEQWVSSGKRFHMMRDHGSHVDLIMAGLWGVAAGSLPPLNKLMERFMSAPPKLRHFADQGFLRKYVWPYARTSLMQHDSIFGFMDAVPFPTKRTQDELNIGYRATFTLKFRADNIPPDRSEVTWGLFRIKKSHDGSTRAMLICTYAGVVKDGIVFVHIPIRYAQWIKQGTARIGLIAHAVPHGAPPPQPPIPAALA
jgi:hypothetical protein